MKRKIPLYNTSLKNLEQRLRAFKDSVPSMLKDVVISKQDIIIELIAQKQLYEQGIDGYSKSIMEYRPYRPHTIAYKKRKQQPYTRVTLKDKGNFYRQMYIVFDSDGFYITSRSRVTPILTKKYGRAIFRSTDKNLSYLLREHIRKEFVKRLKATINERTKR